MNMGRGHNSIPVVPMESTKTPNGCRKISTGSRKISTGSRKTSVASIKTPKSRKTSVGSRKTSVASINTPKESRKTSVGSRKTSVGSRKASIESVQSYGRETNGYKRGIEDLGPDVRPKGSRKSSLVRMREKMDSFRGSMQCVFPILKGVSSSAGMRGYDGDSDGAADSWSLGSDTSYMSKVSDGDDMSICYPLDPDMQLISRKPAMYGGRRSIRRPSLDPLQPMGIGTATNGGINTNRSQSRNFSFAPQLTRFLSMEVKTVSFTEHLTKDIKALANYLGKLEGTTAMHVVNQRLDAVADAQIDCPLPYQCFTPLGYAVLQNDPDLVKLLLEYDADTSAKPCVITCDCSISVLDPESPLHLAAVFDCTPQVLLHLVEYTGDLRDESPEVQGEVLKYISKCTDIDTVNKLLDQIEDVSMVCKPDMKSSALHLAVENMNLMVVEELLRRHADVNSQDVTMKTPLMVACYHKVHGNPAFVKTLLAKGADVTRQDIFKRTVLHYAVRFARAGTVELLLNAGADIRAQDARGQAIVNYIFAKVSKGFFRTQPKEMPGILLSMLVTASTEKFVLPSQMEFVDTVAALLEVQSTEENIIINVLESNTHHIKSKDCSHSQRVLHVAVKQQHTDTLRWFLEYGLNVHLQDADGWRAIHYAVTVRSWDIVNLLLKHGADIETATCGGITPIWIMVRYRLLDMAEHFIRKGCDVSRDVKLKFIYHIACDDPKLPLELFDPEQQRANPREQARKALKRISLIDFCLHMRAHKLAVLIFDRLLTEGGGKSTTAAHLKSTQDIVRSQLEEQKVREDHDKNKEEIHSLETLRDKLSHCITE